MKVMIAIPCMEHMDVMFVSSLLNLFKHGMCGAECDVTFHTGSLVYDARNNLAKQAVDLGYDLVLWTDSDMVFEPTAFANMFNVMYTTKADIVSAVCYKRIPPFTPNVFVRDEENGQYYSLNEMPEGPFEIDACGFGFVLMKTDVLRKMPDKPFNPFNGIGEDIAFCERAKEQGISIVATKAVKVGHIGKQIIGEDAFELCKTKSQNSELNQ